MGFQEVKLSGINLTDYLGKPLTGFYTGKHEIEGKYGDEVHHNFLKEDGTNLKVYGFTTLNRKLEAVQIGSFVRVTYTGKESVKTKFGFRDVHQCKVEVDPSRKMTDIIDSSSPSPVKKSEPIPVAPDVEIEETDDDLPF